jgi:tRNA-2-methylthio-N6-dimethylallyladenosine synthase
MKFYIHTFGCQMNTSDSEHLTGLLLASGMTASESPEESDLIIVNTCAVREKSEEKLYSLLGRMENLKKERGTLIGVVGCVAQLYKSKLWDKKPTLDFIIGPDNYRKIPQLILSHSREKALYTEWSTQWHDQSVQQIKRDSNVSAFITIMEGCNNFCAYCVVPYTRGREKYRPIHQILFEAEDLASKGYKEIQLLGQNVNSYIDPETGKNFAVLLREINQVSNVEWIRFITSHPKNFTDEIAYAMHDSDKVCHQLHLPIQSGSTSVLQRMNRGYTREEYCKKIDLLRKLMTDIHLSTDIIVGFPDENQAEFQETLNLLEHIQYTNIFSFRYCPRPHTSAAKKEDNVAFEVKKNRLIQVQALQKKIQLKKNNSMIGQSQKVLCTGVSKKDTSVYSGRNSGFQVVNFTSPEDVLNQFVQVKILSCGPFSLFGEVTEHSFLNN